MIDSVMQSDFEKSLDDALKSLADMRLLQPGLRDAALKCIESLRNGHKLIACGNGGSACQAQHLVGELVGRYKSNRAALPAIALTADSAVLTCIGNDYSYEDIFARQIRALGQPGDVLVAFSTSGRSANVLRALEACRELQITSIAFLGRDGGAAAPLADCALIIPHTDTARVQEAHLFLMHSLMDLIELGVVHGMERR
jgi:D-sedoheptulose 7-phosphate isomerase